MMGEPNELLPWAERVAMLSINPDSASRDDVARLASDLMESRQKAPSRSQTAISGDIQLSASLSLPRWSLFTDGMRETPSGPYFKVSDVLNATGNALNLLERASATFENYAPDKDWFREYFLLTGTHAVLTDEGWQTGDTKSILDADDILDEVNAPHSITQDTASPKASISQNVPDLSPASQTKSESDSSVSCSEIAIEAAREINKYIHSQIQHSMPEAFSDDLSVPDFAAIISKHLAANRAPESSEIAAIRERRAKISHTPWWANIHAEVFGNNDVDASGQAVAECVLDDTAEFIANAPTDIDTLLAVYDVLPDENNKLRTTANELRQGLLNIMKETSARGERIGELLEEAASLREEVARLKGELDRKND